MEGILTSLEILKLANQPIEWNVSLGKYFMDTMPYRESPQQVEQM